MISMARDEKNVMGRILWRALYHVRNLRIVRPHYHLEPLQLLVGAVTGSLEPLQLLVGAVTGSLEPLQLPLAGAC
jgi:hypothetical protein